MIGELDKGQIEQVLQQAIVGRIGCYYKGKVYVVPVTYAFRDGYLYAHSKEGLKINLMRKNPSVCFQVDEIENMVTWRSVILWGDYQELKYGKEEQEGMKILSNRLSPYVTSASVHHDSQDIHPPQVVEKKLKAIFFRIKINEMTGRFEKPDLKS